MSKAPASPKPAPMELPTWEQPLTGKEPLHQLPTSSPITVSQIIQPRIAQMALEFLARLSVPAVEVDAYVAVREALRVVARISH